MPRIRTNLALAVSTVAFAAVLPAQTVVSPTSRADAEGSSSTSYPLGRFNARLQQLHADLPASLTTIRGHAYRRDAIATRGQADAFQTELEIRLSVAATTPDAASTNFDQNRGPSPVVVLPRQVVSFPATDRPSADPAPSFEYAIPYATPFQRPAGAVVCVETIVYGNQTAAGNDRNFTAYLDAHLLSGDGSVEQPGFRYGAGCPAAGSGTAHYANMDLLRDPNELVLSIHSRFGVPSTTSSAQSALLLGVNPGATPWAWLPACTVWNSFDLLLPMAGATDTSGHHDATFPRLGNLPPGLRLYAQVVSGDVTTGELTFSDGCALTVPGLEPVPIQACRIASASDRDATTGTRSFAVPVTEFF